MRAGRDFICNLSARLKIRGMDLYNVATVPAFFITYIFVQITSVIISVALAPFYLVAGGRYTILRALQRPNRLAIPGRPTTAWPRYFPLAGSAKVHLLLSAVASRLIQLVMPYAPLCLEWAVLIQPVVPVLQAARLEALLHARTELNTASSDKVMSAAVRLPSSCAGATQCCLPLQHQQHHVMITTITCSALSDTGAHCAIICQPYI